VFGAAGWLAAKLLKPLVLLFNGVYSRIAAAYPRIIAWSLAHRAAVVVFALALFGSSLPIAAGLGIELIPQLSQGEFNVDVKLAPGAPLERTDAALLRLDDIARALPGVERTYAVAGTGSRLDTNPEESGENG